jgi:hypothetical protein
MQGGIEIDQAGGDRPERRDLSHGEVDEDDAAPQDLDPQRNMGGEHQQAGGEGRGQQTKI